MSNVKIVVIPDDYQNGAGNVSSLHEDSSCRVISIGDVHKDVTADEILSQAEALILIRERTVIDSEFLKRTPKVKVISQTGKVARNIDLDLCRAHGIDVVEGKGSPIAPAELTWLLIQNSVRQFVPSVNAMMAGKWQVAMGDTVSGKTLGVVGYGKIGKRVIEYAKAFGMNVCVWGSERALNEAKEDGIDVPVSREEFFSSCDVISLHQRLVPDTQGNITYDDLFAMKPSAVFVNTARAELVESGALEQALDDGRPGFAALDVYDQEPIWTTEHPMLKRANVLCSPHLGYVAQSSYDLYFDIAFQNIKRYMSGDRSHVINA
ncbi:D-2-hydroxyacid dehydrogenase family protein (plasmid) [Vibrio tubiashii]|uniref:D-2-hydroxyacid dehydrogenase family protein n=1 Tax=Vibrio tubiashii TaxID=29498 RepID=UPI00234EEE8A|nr:D-2-hydroxyacid dehydrogenase family protein [Vibrio tubiashii]WCP70348.1 D-2-hydroxyacid dehydrogenase family protein [Vibrio tubiashii]